LSDGTLAGADLDFPKALRVMINDVGVSPSAAIAMATSIPAGILRSSGGFGQLADGKVLHAIYLDHDFQFRRSIG
jgi:N-acetylglucosamine-6-phosphate deacetylase